MQDSQTGVNLTGESVNKQCSKLKHLQAMCTCLSDMQYTSFK